MKYGDAVVLVVNDRPSNALVLQSNAVDGEEHLTLISLDPKHNDSTILSGEQMRQAVITGYGVEPVKEGKHAGWRLSWDKPVESEEDGKPTDTLTDEEVAEVIREQLGKGEEVQPPNGANLQQVFTAIAAYNRETLERLNTALTTADAITPDPINESAPEITQDDAASLAALSGSGGLAGQTGAEVRTQAEAPQSTPEA